MWYLGLMSGTSMDGIDIAALKTDGETIESFGPTGQRAYTAQERALLTEAMADAQAVTDRSARPGCLAEAEAMITHVHAGLIAQFLQQEEIEPRDVAAVGFHGQTLLHRPEKHLTIQIGDGDALADQTGMRVVWDMRAADVAAGGQGAPLVPVYHRALAVKSSVALPCVIVNLGGVANVTFITASEMIAFDTGPANALMDDWMLQRTGVPMDRDGAAAAAGRVWQDRVDTALNHPFLSLTPPKSVDRHDFDKAATSLTEGLSTEDGAATLAAFSVACLARARAHLPEPPLAWIMTGGGARNPTIVHMLGEALAPARVHAAESLGWETEFVEAQAFAYLAARSLKGLPLTYSGTTGVDRPLTGGRLSDPRLAKSA
jgi:anhydro-N-acetylmuramic acid kinase